MTAVETPQRTVVFTLDGQRYGLTLSCVERVARIVEITPLPDAPDIVLGLINVHGRLIPVMNLRRRFRLPERESVLTDQVIVAHTRQRAVVLLADSIIGVIPYAHEQFVDSGDILPALEHVEAVVKLEDGLILIQDLDKFLSLDETRALDRAMAQSR